MRAEIEETGSYSRWEFDRRRLFERTDYMALICQDLCHVLQVTFHSFGLLVKHLFLEDLKNVHLYSDLCRFWKSFKISLVQTSRQLQGTQNRLKRHCVEWTTCTGPLRKLLSILLTSAEWEVGK